MSEVKAVINGIDVFEHDYDRWREHEQVNALASEGVGYRFYKFLRDYDLIDEYESVDDVYANFSGARDGNRFDIHDNYRFSYDDAYKNLEISFLYVVNGNLWGVLFDKATGNWYGDFEIPNI